MYLLVMTQPLYFTRPTLVSICTHNDSKYNIINLYLNPPYHLNTDKQKIGLQKRDKVLKSV